LFSAGSGRLGFGQLLVGDGGEQHDARRRLAVVLLGEHVLELRVQIFLERVEPRLAGE
jgi:hypothetical protein